MKTKLKAVRRKAAAKPAVAVLEPSLAIREAKPVVPVKDRRLRFGARWDYAPAPETTPVKIDPRYELFIDGKFVAPHSGKYFDSINPATEERLCQIAHGDAFDVDAAVKAARRAYETVWSKMPGRERGKYLFRIARIVQEKSRELAVLESMDGGKPIKESRDFDVPMVAAHFFYHGGWADKLQYAFPGKTPRPLGVAGQIIPWNFPLLMAAWKIAPALACGNTVVLKPSKTTSISALHLARIFQEAGLNEGALAALVDHDAFRCGSRPNGIEGLPNAPYQRINLPLERELARFNFAQIENIVDQLQQMFGVAMDMVHESLL